jgi:hypothetical protein
MSKKKKVSPEAAPEEVKSLSSVEMKEYEIFDLKRRIYSLEIDLVEASKGVHKRDKEISDLKFQICSHKILERKDKVKTLETRKLEFDKGVRERLDIKEEKFGYHPASGDIVLSR